MATPLKSSTEVVKSKILSNTFQNQTLPQEELETVDLSSNSLSTDEEAKRLTKSVNDYEVVYHDDEVIMASGGTSEKDLGNKELVKATNDYEVIIKGNNTFFPVIDALNNVTNIADIAPGEPMALQSYVDNIVGHSKITSIDGGTFI